MLGAANLAWLFTIVLMPVTTALTGALGTTRTQIALYVGVMAASGWALFWVSLAARQSIRSHGGDPGPRERLAGSLGTAVMFTISGVFAVAVPAVNYFGLTLMMLTPPVARLLRRALAS